MTAAMLLVGLVFGMALTVTVALFVILSMDGHFSRNVRAVSIEVRAWLKGRRREVRAPVATLPAATDTRVRALLDEIRVMQKLMSQAQVERERHVGEIRKATEEIAALRAAVTDRDERLTTAEATLHDETARAGSMRTELTELAAQLARSKRDIKDLETELSLVQSGDGMKAISEEVARLSAERDELTARLKRMIRPAAVAE